jgi:hypothetical protein
MPRRRPLGPAPPLVATFFREHLLAEGRGPLRFLSEVGRQLVELSLLLGGEVFGLGTEEPPTACIVGRLS